jgi:hypothetical protein
MMGRKSVVNLAAVAVATLVLGAPVAFAQGKIVCWKDASGKVVGCGDKVPAEFAGSGTKELDKQGNVRKTGESADDAAKRQAREKELAQAKAEENKRVKEQKRQDDALLNTFTNEKEIDLKRDRELRALDNFIVQQNAALKGVNDRLADARKRAEGFEKDKKPVAPAVKDDLARAEREKARVEGEITANEKAKAETTTKYAEFRRRFMELKGIAPTDTPSAAAAPAPAATAVPTAPAATAKK